MNDDGDDGDDVDDNGGVETMMVSWWFWSIALVVRLAIGGRGGVAGIGSDVNVDADADANVATAF